MKHLYRSKTNKKIAGICGGFAEYFDLDPSLIRIIWLSAVLIGGTGLLLYLICWFIMPENPGVSVSLGSRPLTRSTTNKIFGGVCGGLGEYFEVDPILIRVGFIILTLGAGWGLILYIILWFSLPKKPVDKVQSNGTVQKGIDTRHPRSGD